MNNNQFNFYKDVLDNTAEGIIVYNKHFEILYTNKAIESSLNYSKEELKSKKNKDIISIENINCPICKGQPDAIISEEHQIHIGELITKDKEVIPVKISHSTITNVDTKNFISTISPLSETICLNQAHVDFVSTVSHELRTPLTSIRGFADTLISAGDMLGKEQQLRFFKIIIGQVDRLTRLVEDLLTVSRLESQKDKSVYKCINLNEAIEPIIQIVKQKAPGHNFLLDIVEHCPAVYADSDKLEQVLTNLIDNAAKYSYTGSNITVKASYSQDSNEIVSIQIQDEGVGIPDEHIDKIFTRFSRIDNPLTREVQGTGLGLYITKTLVDKMNGKIYVAQNQDKGSTFTIELPVATCERHAQKFREEGED